MQRLNAPTGFAGQFAGDTTEVARIEVATKGCAFTARVGNGPAITDSPFQLALAGPDGQVQHLSIMISGPSGATAVVTITPVADLPEVDLMLIDDLVPFPINRYRFNTTSATHNFAAAKRTRR